MDVDFATIMKRMRRLRAEIAPVDGHARGTEAGVRVFQGTGRFVDAETIEVVGIDDKDDDDDDDATATTKTKTNPPPIRIKFGKAVIATGGRPNVPQDIPGLIDAPYTTSDTLFNGDVLPPRMIILGSGVVALEMAQAFAIFGSNVTVLVRGDELLPQYDTDAGPTMRQILEDEDGVTFLTNARITNVETLRRQRQRSDDEDPHHHPNDLPLIKVSVHQGGATAAVVEEGQQQQQQQRLEENIIMECECLLVATGRIPNLEGLNLDVAGIEYDSMHGITVDDTARSVSHPHVYAVGDCVSHVPRLTHMSGEMAKLVVQNALFHDDWKLSSLVIPACMYTEPELASVGDVTANRDEVDVYVTSLERNDRAILDNDDDVRYGYVKIFCEKDSGGTILGASMIASRAGEMINEVSLAMKYGLSLEDIGRNVHCYPTQGEAVMSCGLQLINSKWKRYNDPSPT